MAVRVGGRFLVAAIAVLVGVAGLAPRPAMAKDVIVFAAASLKNALDDAIAAYAKAGGGTRKNFLGNAIVLIGQTSAHPAPVAIKPGFDLKGLLKDGRLAMADPSAVPAGKYGKEALQTLGVWDSVKDKVASAENVRGALLFVDRGETPYGIVYATDAAADKKVTIVGAFPADSHKPIIYPIALTATSRDAEARKFLTFLESPAAKPAFVRQGFT